MTESERLARLAKAGKMSSDEAISSHQGIENFNTRLVEVCAVDDRPPLMKWPAAKWRFLRGAITESEMRQHARELCVRLAALFVLIDWILDVVGVWAKTGSLVGAIKSESTSVWGGLFIAGPLFGYLFYRWFMRRQIDQLVELANGLGGPLEVIDAFRLGQCPTCSAENSARVVCGLAKWHWRLNPGLAFNEVVLGQRAPSNTRLCRECGSEFIFCPVCKKSIDAYQLKRSWGRMNCHLCGYDIPSIRNWLGWLITAPIDLVQFLVARMRRPRRQMSARTH